MNLNEHIVKLTLDELTGGISPADKVYLYDRIDKDQEARRSWEETKRWYHSSETQASITQLSESNIAMDILDKARKQQKGKIYWYRASAAAVAAVILVFGIIWISSQSRIQDTTTTFSSTSYGKDIELKIGKKTVVLAEEREQLEVDGISVQHKDRELQYSSNEHIRADWASLHIPAGKDYKITLSDGTEIWLNSGSCLQFPLTFQEKIREVRIEGEAFIKVTKNATRPFIVHLPHSAVQVLGTAFNVNTYTPGREIISLVNGKIKVATEKDSLVLNPGSEAKVGKNGAIQHQIFDQEETLSWRGGQFIFNNTTIKEVSNVLPRWFGVTVVLDKKIESSQFTGVIDRNKPIRHSLDILEATNGLRYSIKGDTVYLNPKNDLPK